MASEVKSKPLKPAKGILKASSSFDKPELHHPGGKEMKWDEMNILATHHPADKDYGHMKIDEPKTPYNRMSDVEDEDEGGRRHSVSDQDVVNPESVAKRLKDVGESKKLQARVSGDEEESSSEEEETEDDRAKRRIFEQKRKLHYNEFQAVKLAKQLMEDEDDDEEEDETEEVEEEKDKVQDQKDEDEDQEKNIVDSSVNNI